MTDTADKSIKNGTALAGAILIAVIFSGVGFGVGRYVLPQGAQQAGARQFAGGQGAQQPGGANMRNRAGGGMAGNGMISGELVKKDATTMSIKQRDGSMKLVLITDKTKATKMVDGSMDDIKTGTNVMVSGTSNSDGSVTAQIVQLRPDFPAGQQPPAVNPQDQPSPAKQ